MLGETSLGLGGRVRLRLRLTTESCPHAVELRTAVERQYAPSKAPERHFDAFTAWLNRPSAYPWR